jgi:hypothetical protein
MNGALSATNPTPGEDPLSPHAVLHVVAGVHAGASLALVKDDYTIGSGTGMDIVLSDEGVAPEHGAIRMRGRSVTVEARAGAITVNNHRQVPQGYGFRTGLPVEFRLGNAVLHVALPAGAPAWAHGWGMARAAMVPVVCCALLILTPGFTVSAGVAGLGAACMNALRGASATTFSRQSMPKAAQDLPKSALPLPAAAAADALKAKLKDAGLGEVALQVDNTRIVASGQVSNEKRNAWTDIEHWFDRTYGGRYVLASTVEIRAPAGQPKFDLQAISYGDTPYVITADGHRHYRGAALDKGWIIKEISPGRLTLTKDGNDLELQF